MFYAGQGVGGPVFLPKESHLLVLGPPRSGKTRTLVVPNIIHAPGPVVATSTKSDLVEMSSLDRSRFGELLVFDPSGRVPLPSKAKRIYWSPIDPAGSYTNALTVTRAMVDAATLRGGVNGGYSHWNERAASLVAPLIHAAQIAGYEMDAVIGWLNRRQCKDPAGILKACGEELALDSLMGVLASEDRERSSIFSTALGLLGSYNFPEIHQQYHLPRFEANSFLRSRDTLYIVSPSYFQKLLAPVIVGLIDDIKNRSFELSLQSEVDRSRHAVSLILDEMANVAPIGSISSILSEGASQKVLLLGALQDLSQARVRWGESASGFVTLFGSVIVFPGIADVSTLHQFSEISGKRAYEAVSRNFTSLILEKFNRPSSVSRSVGHVPVLEPWQVARGSVGQGILFRKYHPVSKVYLSTNIEIGPTVRHIGGLD